MGTYQKRRRKPNPNRTLGTLDVLRRLRDQCPVAFDAARVVGQWVWVEFAEKPAADVRAVLKALGFHWNRDREAWQHPCGVFSARGTHDPRWKYGAVSASALLGDDDAKAVA
jgi:hypothetical protein